MKAIKTILLIFVIFTFIQCNKDAKVEPIIRILPNGTYQFSFQTKYGNGFYLYKIIDNKVYGYLKRNIICLEKMAGEIKLFEDSIAVITLHKQMPNLNNGCVYHNEFYGGDTAVMHPFNIELYKDNNLRDALKGRFYELSPAPFSNTIFGSFNLTYTPTQ